MRFSRQSAALEKIVAVAVHDDASHIMSLILRPVAQGPVSLSVNLLSADLQNLGLMGYGPMGNDVRLVTRFDCTEVGGSSLATSHLMVSTFRLSLILTAFMQ
jgi:hypothetical protein